MHALSALASGVILGTVLTAAPLSWNTHADTTAKSHLRGTATHIDTISRTITMLLDSYDMGGTINFTYNEDTLWFELSFDAIDGVIVKEKLQPTGPEAVAPGVRISLAEADASPDHITAPSVIIAKPL